MSGKISIKYQEATELADVIRNRGSDLQASVRKIEAEVASQIDACWSDSSGDFAPPIVMREDIRARLAALRVCGESLVDLANKMQKTAEIYRDVNGG